MYVVSSEQEDCLLFHDQESTELVTLKPKAHTYPLFIIQLAIQQRLECFSSWRSIEKNFKLWSQFFPLPIPHFTTIRLWFLKLGLFALQQPKEIRSDWIFIIDIIAAQGQNKCLLILGLSHQRWLELFYEKFDNCLEPSYLKHDDVNVLSIEILQSTKGEIIADKINLLASQVGQPLQIISDHGSDIKRGIELYIKDHKSTIYTYDFSHQVALWLKHLLSFDLDFQEFLELSNLTRSQIQQTELSFLIPPKARSKARYHNIDILVDWGLSIIAYWKKQDFSLISNLFLIDWNALCLLQGQVRVSTVLILMQNYGFATIDFLYFSQYLIERLETEEDFDLILNATNFGRRRFLEKFSWLLDYEAKLKTIAEVLEVFSLAKLHLSLWGLHSTAVSEWSDFEADYHDSPPAVIQAFQQVHDYLTVETKLIPPSLSLPATSDIIESLFGKYKIFLDSAPFSEINETVLSLILFTTELTTDFISQAMENITNNDVFDWIKSTFGQSSFSKRKQAFSNS